MNIQNLSRTIVSALYCSLISILLFFRCRFLRSGLHCDGVQLTLTLLGDETTTVLLVLLYETHFLELLQNVTADLTRSQARGVFLDATADPLAVTLLEATDASAAADIDLADHRRSAHVEPIRIQRWQLLALASLHNVSPFWDFEATLTLEVLREGDDELVSPNVLHSDHLASSLEMVIVHSDGHDGETFKHLDLLY